MTLARSAIKVTCKRISSVLTVYNCCSADVCLCSVGPVVLTVYLSVCQYRSLLWYLFVHLSFSVSMPIPAAATVRLLVSSVRQCQYQSLL